MPRKGGWDVGPMVAGMLEHVDFRRALEHLAATRLRGSRLLLASNRGPVELFRDAHGRLGAKRGLGGLVTAVSGAIGRVEATWVAAALTEADAAAAADPSGTFKIPPGAGPERLALALVNPEREDYRRYYDDIGNRLLWFLMHGIGHAPEEPDFDSDLWSSWAAYRRVNRAFASRLVELAGPARRGPRPVFLIQDFHLFLVPGMLRRKVPGACVGHFTHVPWPGPDAWLALPRPLRREILESMLACDVIGFHTPRYAWNFCHTCRDFLGADTDPAAGVVRYRGRVVRVRSYPISVDPEQLAAFVDTPEVRRRAAALSRLAPPEMRVILQVARTDPSKNILRSLKAFDHYLQSVPEARGRTVFWGLLPASRQGAEPYRRYLHRIEEEARRLDATWRTPDWRPVMLFTDDDYARGIAAMMRYDVLLVTSLADGMNLVAKEGPLVNRRHGVLVLSENVGAAEELAGGAILVHPYDVLGMSGAIAKGLSLPGDERRRMHAVLRGQVRRNPVHRWLYEQLRDLLAAPPGEVGQVGFADGQLAGGANV